MPTISLRPHQLEAVQKMKNGCILCGSVGSGKSRTALAYYYIRNGGKISSVKYHEMKNPKDLYIITTARKRDTLEWEGELTPFLLSPNPEVNYYNNKIVIDSWNNIKKYADVVGSFFIFDEQRVVGSGAWAKAFQKIVKRNEWILLSATPGDTWMDYIQVFVANGFYRNKTEFLHEHVVFRRFSKYPQVERYLNTGKLLRLRKQILIPMSFQRNTVAHHEDVYVKYDTSMYRDICRNRWNIWTQKPLKNASELCYAMRKCINISEDRQVALLELLEKHPKAIIFYNFDYELEILKTITAAPDRIVAEWNGHQHDPLPLGDSWVYLVQYSAGAEGWNCITTDTIIFYSLNYSYKTTSQAAGRIDRLNTPFSDLYYYHLKARSGIDLGISKALNEKRTFNESAFVAQPVNKTYLIN